MERNIDRNLRMAKREARRFFGIRRGLGRKGIFLVAMLITFGGFYLAEPYVAHFQLFQNQIGWFLLLGMVLVVAAIYFVFRAFGVYLWGRPRQKFPPPRRPEDPRYRRWPRSSGWEG